MCTHHHPYVPLQAVFGVIMDKDALFVKMADAWAAVTQHSLEWKEDSCTIVVVCQCWAEICDNVKSSFGELDATPDCKRDPLIRRFLTSGILAMCLPLLQGFRNAHGEVFLQQWT